MRRLLGKICFAPVSWISCAILLLLVFGMFHLMGWRQDTAIISGTSAGPSYYASAMRGLLYGLAYFVAILISPILILTAAIDAVLRRCRIFRKPADAPGT